MNRLPAVHLKRGCHSGWEGRYPGPSQSVERVVGRSEIICLRSCPSCTSFLASAAIIGDRIPDPDGPYIRRDVETDPYRGSPRSTGSRNVWMIRWSPGYRSHKDRARHTAVIDHEHPVCRRRDVSLPSHRSGCDNPHIGTRVSSGSCTSVRPSISVAHRDSLPASKGSTAGDP